MIYDVKRSGNNAWYVAFDKRADWNFTKCRNVSPDECIQIAKTHRSSIAT